MAGASLILGTWLVPAVAAACSWNPHVANVSMSGSAPLCLRAFWTYAASPGQEYTEPSGEPLNLELSSRCDFPVEVSIADCVDCDDAPFTLGSTQEDSEWTRGIREIRDVGIDLERDLGDEIEVVVDWTTEDGHGSFTVLFEITDTHPSDQSIDRGCGPLGCSVVPDAPGGWSALVLLLGIGWARTRSPRGRLPQ